MADEVKPAAPVAPKTPEDYVAAALAVSDAQPKEPEVKKAIPESKETPLPEVKSEAKEPEKKAEEPTGDKEKPLSTEKKEGEGLPTNLRKSFEKLAAEKAAIRAERQAMDAEKKYGPAGERAARAAAAGDTLGVLAAYGLKYETVAEQVVTKATTPQSKPAEGNPLEGRLERLERELQGERNMRARVEVTAKLQDVLKANDADFGLINEMGAHADVLHELEMYMAQHGGRPPGDTFEESVSIAAELVQDRFVKEKAKWSKLLEKERDLTEAKKPAIVVPAVEKSAESGPRVETRTVKTLSNSLASSPGGAPRSSTKLKSGDEYLEEALAVLQAQSAE